MKYTLSLSLENNIKALFGMLLTLYSWIDQTGLSTYALGFYCIFSMLDIVLGVSVAKSIESEENPSSKKAKIGVASKLLIFLLVGIVAIVYGAFDKENMIKVLNVELTILLVAEAYSIINHIETLATGVKKTEFNTLSFFVKQIKGKIKNLLNKIISK